MIEHGSIKQQAPVAVLGVQRRDDFLFTADLDEFAWLKIQDFDGSLFSRTAQEWIRMPAVRPGMTSFLDYVKGVHGNCTNDPEHPKR
jgi:hypothetical protein